MMIQLKGTHGTASHNVDSICKSNFNLSLKPDDWLGNGVYFFTEGISCPYKNAEEWARNQAHNKSGVNHYSDFAVLEATIVCEEYSVFNITNNEGLHVFNVLRDEVIQEHDKKFVRNAKFHAHDKIIWDIICDDGKLEVVIHNLYIKNKTQRIKNINSSVPNTTVMCVKNSDLIDLKSLKVVKDGEC